MFQTPGEPMKNTKLAVMAVALPSRSPAAATRSPPRKPRRAPQRRAGASAGGAEVKIGHVAPLTGGIAHLGKDNENGARLAIEEANAAGVKIDGKDVKFDAGRRGRPGRSESRHHGRAEARRRESGRRGRPPELRHLDSRLADLQPGRHPGDLRLGDQPQAHRAGIQEPVPRRRPRRPAGPGDRELHRRRAQAARWWR